MKTNMEKDVGETKDKGERVVIFPQKSYFVKADTREQAVRKALKRYVLMIKKVEGLDGSLGEWLKKSK